MQSLSEDFVSGYFDAIQKGQVDHPVAQGGKQAVKSWGGGYHVL